MEYDEEDKENNNIEENDLMKQAEIIIKLISKLNIDNTQELIKEDKKSLSNKIQYINKIFDLYLKEKENSTNGKKYVINIIRRKRLGYLINIYKKLKNNMKYKESIFKNKKTINNYFIIICFCFFSKVISIKKQNVNKKSIISLYKLLNNILCIAGKLFLEEIIEINYLELIIKLLLTFSIKKSMVSLGEEDINGTNEISNLIFFKCGINLLKDVFNKIILQQNNFTEKQNEIINNIITFILNNIIYSDTKKKQIKYINKHFLSMHDYYTTQLLDLYRIIMKTNSDIIIKKYLDLISDIYSFNFRYKNLMRPLLKQFEPLFINLNKKDLKEINDELYCSNFTLELISILINKENKIASEKPCLIKEGFYFNNSESGIVANIKSLENDFTIIFSFNVEKTNKEEIVLLSLVTEKSVSKFILKEKIGKNSYEMFCEDKNNNLSELKIFIEKETNYIFSISIKNDKLFKNSIKTRYIKDTDNNCYNGLEIKIKNFKKENIKLFFGCNINPSTNKIENKFKGFLGNIFIFNSKNYKTGNANDNFEGDFILELKGDYKSIYNLILEKENPENNIFINKQRNLLLKEKLKNKDIEKNLTGDNIQLIISPEYFKLLNYYDDIDYINTYNNLLEDKINNEYFIKRKYFDLKLKSESNDEDKAIFVYSSFFDKNFHIFKNEFTLNEFIKYDGIHLLSLIMEYYYQILNNIYEKKMMKETQEIKDLCKKIEKNILENLQFFNENILQNMQILNVNLADINKFFYTMSITLVKFIEIEEINFDNIKYLLKIIDKIPYVNENFVNDIKISLIEFILNPNIFKKEEVNMEILNSTLQSLLKIFNKNIERENFKKKLIREEYFNQLFLLLWIFDEINVKENKNINKEIFIQSRKLYTDLLSQSLKIIIITKNEEDLELEISDSKKNKIEIEKSKDQEVKDEEKEKKNKIIEFVFEKLFEYKDNTNIFCSLINIILELDLIQNANTEKIIKTLKSIINIKNREERNTKNKILKSCIIYLVQIYLVENINENLNEKKFHHFLKKLGMNLDVIYSLISSINLLKSKEIKIKADSYDETLININLKELNENHYNILYIIKTIFEDIAFILINSIWDKNDQNSSKDILEVLEKNIDLIFNSVKESQNQFLQDFFSSDSKICAEFFYFKYKTVNGKTTFLENLIKKYNILLKIFSNPFFFKFYHFLFKEVPDGINDNTNEKNKLFFLTGIINSFSDFIGNNKSEENIFFIHNLFNFGILINMEYEKKSSLLFENKNFQKIFVKYISLLDMSGVLYCNYFIELNGINGKVISEIIFDIYFKISNISFEQDKFIEIFIKFNKKNKESFTIFYFMDLCKEKFLEKDKKTKDDVKGFISYYENITFLRNYLKNNKIKLFLGKNLYKIEHVNFSIYFLAKSFIYYKKGNLNSDFSKFLKESFFSCLSEDIYNLYTQKSRFYGNELCKSFPLYYFVKTFIETNIIPDKNFGKYIDYINNEMPMELKDEYNLESCYSSRLSKNKKYMKKKNSLDEDDLNEKKNNLELENVKDIYGKRSSIMTNNTSYLFHFSSKTINVSGLNELESSFKSSKSNSESKLSSEKDDDSSLSFLLNSEKLNLNTFSDLKKDRQIINSGKKFFIQKIFAEAFKNLLFYDKNFVKIKLTFLTKFRQYKNVEEDTKQLNYPTVQKNYSNTIEPKIFVKKDSNFYDQFYLKISHKYLNKDLIFKNLSNVTFYPHIFKFDEKNTKTKSLVCELVTLKYISLGKMFFFDDYIIFKTEQEDPRDISKDLDIFFKYGISNKDKDFPSKKKWIVLYAKFIGEIIQRRTLLVNNSVEIFMKNGKSYFFNFFRSSNANLAYLYFIDLNNNLIQKRFKKFDFCTNSNEEDIKKLINSFKKGKITNYEYILKLNKYSTRTYNDTSQYPIFPWLVQKRDKNQEIIKKIWSNENLNQKEILQYFRDMNYPHVLQSEKKREEAKNNFTKEEEEQEKLDDGEKFPTHFINHYSTSAYVYYFLMRLNPFLKNFIKLQSGELEDPNRTFNNFKDTEETVEFQNDNRELIPDFFCYFDFLLNSNCNLFGKYNSEFLIDDFSFSLRNNTSEYYNRISSFAVELIDNNRLLNNYFVSRIINNWIDIIFGTRQLPSNHKDLLESCNVYKKVSYEQKTDLEQEIKPFEEKISLNQKNEEEEKKLMKKIEPMIVSMINFGVCPKKILDENVVYDGKIKTYDSIFKSFKYPEDKLIYFNYINEESFILVKDIKKNKIKTRTAISFENKNLKEKESIIYNLKSMNLMKEKNGIKNIQLYQYRYALSSLYLSCNKVKILIVLSCRYFENYFRVQCQDKIINIFYEDFITCIKGRNLFEDDNIFYTGLINGKLTEWEIIPLLDNNIKNKKKVIKCLYNFNIRERKHVYAHKESISVIEIYPKQKILITAGEDKFIYIRKTFDFELLTAIDLTYSFGNPIISKYLNIFPSMIKVSDLNLLFVMVYDYNSKNNFIRGYNLNGIFFAQTDQMMFEENAQINNFSFTKYGNLIISFYNSNKFWVVNAGILSPIWIKELEEKEEGKKEKKEKSKIPKEIGNRMVEFNCENGEFYILKEHEIIFTSINDKAKLKEFEAF